MLYRLSVAKIKSASRILTPDHDKGLLNGRPLRLEALWLRASCIAAMPVLFNCDADFAHYSLILSPQRPRRSSHALPRIYCLYGGFFA